MNYNNGLRREISFDEAKSIKDKSKVLVLWNVIGNKALNKFIAGFVYGDAVTTNSNVVHDVDSRASFSPAMIAHMLLHEIRYTGMMYNGDDMANFSFRVSGVVRKESFRLLPEYFDWFALEDRAV